ncbi:hypothetical protein Mgra_00008213 [Meloidogyne graminicola]|uniref:Uncharacterized protein n=1 Tax=Meloidogyne graminicola TaxID=189291 RepID=A0A8S9ZGG3_9BILA|nr:hypothetical protein Mgra_00008213 [Meloidogyne graminicola]
MKIILFIFLLLILIKPYESIGNEDPYKTGLRYRKNATKNSQFSTTLTFPTKPLPSSTSIKAKHISQPKPLSKPLKPIKPLTPQHSENISNKLYDISSKELREIFGVDSMKNVLQQNSKFIEATSSSQSDSSNVYYKGSKKY